MPIAKRVSNQKIIVIVHINETQKTSFTACTWFYTVSNTHMLLTEEELRLVTLIVDIFNLYNPRTDDMFSHFPHAQNYK